MRYSMVIWWDINGDIIWDIYQLCPSFGIPPNINFVAKVMSLSSSVGAYFLRQSWRNGLDMVTKWLISHWYMNYPKWGYPQIIHSNRIFHYKPTIFGYPNFRNPPYHWGIWRIHKSQLVKKWGRWVRFLTRQGIYDQEIRNLGMTHRASNAPKVGS